jgi:hypothetical protein
MAAVAQMVAAAVSPEVLVPLRRTARAQESYAGDDLGGDPGLVRSLESESGNDRE